MYDTYSDSPALQAISAALENLAKSDPVCAHFSDKRAEIKTRLSTVDKSCFEVQQNLESPLGESGLVPTWEIMHCMEQKMKQCFVEAQILDKMCLALAYQHMQAEYPELINEIEEEDIPHA